VRCLNKSWLLLQTSNCKWAAALGISVILVYCCNLSGGVALIVWFTANGMCVKNNTIMYVVRTSKNRVISSGDLYLRTCRSGFPIATVLFSYSQGHAESGSIASPVLSKGRQLGAELTFHQSIIGNFMVWSSWNKFIAAIHAPTTFRILFYVLCYHFLGQNCCRTETNILVKNFVFFANLYFPQCLYWPLPYHWFGCYLCFT